MKPGDLAVVQGNWFVWHPGDGAKTVLSGAQGTDPSVKHDTLVTLLCMLPVVVPLNQVRYVGALVLIRDRVWEINSVALKAV